MKKKYENNKRKEKDSKDQTFSKLHEQEAYGLSKNTWNGEGKSVGVSLTSSKEKLIRKAAKEVAEPSKRGLYEDLFGRCLGDILMKLEVKIAQTRLTMLDLFKSCHNTSRWTIYTN